MKDNVVYLRQILECVKTIHEFSRGMSLEQFLQDRKTQSAVIMQLTLMGELAKKVPAEFTSTIPLPWKEIAGFRDRAVHDYYKIDLMVVWSTVQDDLQPVEDEIHKALTQI